MWANRMSREALIHVSGLREGTWELLESGGADVSRDQLNAPTAKAVAEIEQVAGHDLRIRCADVGRGAGGLGVAVEVLQAVAVAGGGLAALGKAARFVKWAYHKIASATGYRPMISLGAAEYLAMADLIDRVSTTPQLVGSGDVNSKSPDKAFTGGDVFFVVLATELELHSYHVSAYGEVYYVGTSPPIPDFMDGRPPYWAGGVAADD